MITHIRVKNFKSWEDSTKVELAPLTGFFGTNSSGKSSLLQMLLLLKQTAEHPDSEEVIFFGDENSRVNLGDFHEVIHGHKEEELLELEFGCKLLEPSTITSLQAIDQYRQQYDYAPIDIDRFTFHTAIKDMSIDCFFYIVGPEATDKIKWENGNLYYGNRHAASMSTSGTNCYGHRIGLTDGFLSLLSSAFEKLFNHVYPLGPTRIRPKRSYHWAGTNPNSVGQTGEDMIASLLNRARRSTNNSL